MWRTRVKKLVIIIIIFIGIWSKGPNPSPIHDEREILILQAEKETPNPKPMGCNSIKTTFLTLYLSVVSTAAVEPLFREFLLRGTLTLRTGRNNLKTTFSPFSLLSRYQQQNKCFSNSSSEEQRSRFLF